VKIRTVLVIVLIAIALPALSENFCMDCTEKPITRPDGSTTRDALCCMAGDDGTCFGGYGIVQPDVGWGCRVQQYTITTVDQNNVETTETGTRCASENVASGCGDSKNPGGGSSGGTGSNPCVINSGQCPPECFSCVVDNRDVWS